MIEAIYFGEVKVTGYTKRADDEMVFVIPAAVETGSYNMKFVLTTGEEETCASSIDVKGAMTTVVLFEENTISAVGHLILLYQQISLQRFHMAPKCILNLS